MLPCAVDKPRSRVEPRRSGMTLGYPRLPCQALPGPARGSIQPVLGGEARTAQRQACPRAVDEMKSGFLRCDMICIAVGPRVFHATLQCRLLICPTGWMLFLSADEPLTKKKTFVDCIGRMTCTNDNVSTMLIESRPIKWCLCPCLSTLGD